MKDLAIIAVILICIIVLGSQHLFNYWLRKDDLAATFGGIVGIIVSAIILGATIYHSVAIFGG